MNEKLKGTIVKGIAGFYYVRAGNSVYQCKARGVFKKDKIVPTVGDAVQIELQENGDALITEIALPRRNLFVRPPIANVDCFVVVFAAAEPEPNLRLIDKFSVMAEKAHTDILLCMNKVDLACEDRVREIKKIYENIYPMCCVSGMTGEGTDELKRLMTGKTCALAGPSGVGKSTLLNRLHPSASVETGEVSRKTGRGRHTTRHVEIFEMEYGGRLFDTPGFTSFDVLEAAPDELQQLYPEFEPFIGKCKYDNCKHMREPDCAVREGVKEGKIQRERYRSYVTQLLEIQENERNKYQ